MKKDLVEIVEAIQEIGKTITKIGLIAIERITKLDFTPVINIIKDISSAIDVDISEEKKKVLEERYCSYGRFGWSIPPSAPIVLKRKAKSLSQADRYMMNFCKRQDMKEIFLSLIKNEKINKTDLEQATYCFNRKMYKSCALLLFSIVDGILIKTQKISKKKRTVLTGKEKLKELNQNKEKYFIFFLHAENIITCIENIYRTPKDFTIKFDFINRDTLSHGMLERNVSKIDCVKLFLLIYNILQLLDLYKIKEL